MTKIERMAQSALALMEHGEVTAAMLDEGGYSRTQAGRALLSLKNRGLAFVIRWDKCAGGYCAVYSKEGPNVPRPCFLDGYTDEERDSHYRIKALKEAEKARVRMASVPLNFMGILSTL